MCLPHGFFRLKSCCRGRTSLAITSSIFYVKRSFLYFVVLLRSFSTSIPASFCFLRPFVSLCFFSFYLLSRKYFRFIDLEYVHLVTMAGSVRGQRMCDDK